MKSFRNYYTTFFFIVIVAFLLQSCLDSTNTEIERNEPLPYSHTDPAGYSANDFLADSNFTELVVEIDYMEGYAPNEEAVDSLELFLEQRLNKNSITIQQPTSIPASGQDTYDISQIRDLEEQHRDAFTENAESDTLTAYMLIVDGHYSQRNVLGIAYYNTSNVFFGGAYDEASGGVGQPSRYKTEATSFRHEFGHLFGLVNVPGSGTEMQTEHQDEQNGHHCDNDQCLMYYAMESTDIFGQFVGEEIPSLDANCRADLEANGGQ